MVDVIIDSFVYCVIGFSAGGHRSSGLEHVSKLLVQQASEVE